MKFAIFGLILSAALFYAVAQEKDEIKIYKRLIPADVLRGECFFVRGWEVTNYSVVKWPRLRNNKEDTREIENMIIMSIIEGWMYVYDDDECR